MQKSRLPEKENVPESEEEWPNSRKKWVPPDYQEKGVVPPLVRTCSHTVSQRQMSPY